MARTLEKPAKKSGETTRKTSVKATSAKSNGTKANGAMTTKKKSQAVETVEAVIISGPRKGEIISFDGNGDIELSGEEEAMLKVAADALASVARNATEAVAAAKRLNAELDAVQGRLHGSA